MKLGKEAVFGLGIIGLLWATLLAGASTTPLVGGFAGLIAGLIFLGAAWLAIMPLELDGIEGFGKILIGLGILNLSLIAILKFFGMTLADYGSVWILALGIVLIWADNLKHLPLIGGVFGKVKYK